MGHGYSNSSLKSNKLAHLLYERNKLHDITPECGCHGMIFVIFYISKPINLINIVAVNGVKLEIRNSGEIKPGSKLNAFINSTKA